MGLPWIRLDTDMFDHPKLLGLFASGDFRAVVVHLSGMAYAGKHETGGFLPKEVLPLIQGRAREARRLVDEEIWTVKVGGWEINGWDKYQISYGAAEARRAKARKAAEARWTKHDRADK